jgi:phage terminase large subunit-like protein
MTLLLDERSAAAAEITGDRYPRIRCVPDYADTSGQEVAELAADAGLVLDEWEADCLDAALGERDDGDWAATEVGIVVPRQNGKGAIVEARELGGLFLLNEPLILHTAHETKTAGEAFLRIKGLIRDSADFSRRVKRINNTHGEEGIELLPTPTIISGAGGRQIRRSVAPRLRFLARSRVGGRGFTGRVVILDEAFELSDAAMTALLPTMSAQPNPQIWYTSTAPNKKKDHNALVLARVRNRGITGSPRLVYLEWSAGELTELVKMTERERRRFRLDRRNWARANPGLGIRLSTEFTETELGALSAEDFDTDRLGVGDWPADDADAWSVIDRNSWLSLIDESSSARDPVALAVDMEPQQRRMATIAAAGVRQDGRVHVEVIQHRAGSDWVAPRLAELARRWHPCAVVIDPASHAGSLTDAVTQAGVEVVSPFSTRDAAQACGQFYDAVAQGALAHLNQESLNLALAGATTRQLGDAWAWDKRNATVDISPLVAVTLATWGFNRFGRHRIPPYDLLRSVG